MRKLSWLAFVLVTVSTVVASADPAARDEECLEQQRAEPPKFHVEVIAGRQTWVTNEPIQICGHRHRPAVAIIDADRRIQYRWLDLEEQFLPKILQTLKQAPMK
jgi:hypothetical protein